MFPTQKFKRKNQIVILYRMEQLTDFCSENQRDQLLNRQIIRCPDNNFASYICCTEGCIDYAFICEEEKCQCIKIRHKKCSQKISTQSFLDQIEQKRKEITPNIKELFGKILKNYENILDKISEDRVQFMEYTNMFGLNQQMIKTIQLINEGNLDIIRGGYIYDLQNKHGKLKETYSPLSMINEQEIRIFWTQIHSLFNKLAYQLVEPNKKIATICKKLSQPNIEVDKIIVSNKNWEFIPIQISAFTQLKNICLSRNVISKISNLESLNKLRILNLQHNKISKIQGLSNLTNLSTLELGDNKISKIEGLDNLTMLRILALYENKIQRFEGLNNLAKLHQLWIWDNKISKIENLDNLMSLKHLKIFGNPLAQNPQELAKISNKIWVI